jgi:hypothetical protein
MRRAQRGDRCTFALLDPRGFIILLLDDSSAVASTGAALGTHVSQFYVASEVALGMLERSLRGAKAQGRDAQEGWRRCLSGAVFWGATVIDAITDEEGHLLGFTHATRRSLGPWEGHPEVLLPPRIAARLSMRWSIPSAARHAVAS